MKKRLRVQAKRMRAKIRRMAKSARLVRQMTAAMGPIGEMVAEHVAERFPGEPRTVTTSTGATFHGVVKCACGAIAGQLPPGTPRDKLVATCRACVPGPSDPAEIAGWNAAVEEAAALVCSCCDNPGEVRRLLR